ncbi:MAG TPA: N-acetylglucosamine-6-phosphate deacetylase [Candidatus Limnocylindrales bacterium]
MSGWLEGRSADGHGIRVRVEGDRIAAVEQTAANPDDPFLLPGLIDLQVNGFGGYDVNADDLTEADVTALAAALRVHGVTGFCPTIVSAPQPKILAALRTIAAARAQDPATAGAILGVHVEGPYISDVDGPRGAHDARWLRDPSEDELADWLEAAPGLVRIVTLAPERQGAIGFIRAAAEAGLVVAIGHTDATPEQIHAATRAGALLSTHLGNGNRAVLPRHPNNIWAQLAADGLTASLIADGHHLPADTLTALVRAKGAEKAVLVSDSVALAGCPPGEYQTPVGGSVTVEEDGRVRLTGSHLLAGGGRSLLDCVRWALGHTGFDLTQLWAMASANPARLLGLKDRGVIEVGARADLIKLDRRLAVL